MRTAEHSTASYALFSTVVSPGWSYRHFRFTNPVGTLPKGFILIETYDAD